METEQRQVGIVKISKNALIEAAEELSGEAFKMFILISALHIDVEKVKQACGDAAFYHALSELIFKNYAFKDKESEDRAIFPDIAYGEEFVSGLFLKSDDNKI